MPQGKGGDSAYWIHRQAVEQTARDYSMNGNTATTRYGDIWRNGEKVARAPGRNPPVAKKAIRAAVQAGAEAANARLRAEEAAARQALGASTFTWKGSTAHGEARGSRFLDHADPCLRPYLKTTPTGVALKMPPFAPPEAKYAAHSVFNSLSDYFTDWWKARNAFDSWVEATPEGWDG